MADDRVLMRVELVEGDKLAAAAQDPLGTNAGAEMKALIENVLAVNSDLIATLERLRAQLDNLPDAISRIRVIATTPEMSEELKQLVTELAVQNARAASDAKAAAQNAARGTGSSTSGRKSAAVDAANQMTKKPNKTAGGAGDAANTALEHFVEMAPMIAAFVLGIGASVVAVRNLRDAIAETVASAKEFAGAAAAAAGMGEAQITYARIRSGQRAEESAAGFIKAQSDMTAVLIDIKGLIADTLLPLMSPIIQVTADILKILNSILELLHLPEIAQFIHDLIQPIVDLLSMVARSVSKSQDTLELQKLNDFLNPEKFIAAKIGGVA